VQTQKYPSDLTDAQWNHIKELVPEAKSGGRPRSLEMRGVVNAILYVTVGGIGWRMMPHDYPKWQSVYHYFREWRLDGTWERIHDLLRAQLRQRAGKKEHPTAGCVDSQSVKTSSRSGERGFDVGKLTKGRKRHILVDTLGLLLAVVVTSASVQDRDGARLLFERLGKIGKDLRLIWVDGAYRGTLLDWVKAHCHFLLEVVMRSDPKLGFVPIPKRWVVERTFAWLSASRRLSKDYEILLETSETFVRIALIRIMLRRLARTPI
jgi:putative transposase